MPYATDTRLTDEWIWQVCQMNPPAYVTLKDGTQSKTSVTTGPVRLIFTDQLLTAKAMKDDDGNERETYSASLLFPLCAQLDLLRQLWMTMTYEQWPEAWDGQKFYGLHDPFRNQIEYVMKKYKGATPGGVLMTPSSKFKPGLVDPNGVEVTDPKLCYPGVWAICELNAHYIGMKQQPGKQPKKRGVNFGLSNVMIIANDENLSGGGGTDPRVAFAGVRQMAGMDVNAAIMRAPTGVMLPAPGAPVVTMPQVPGQSGTFAMPGAPLPTAPALPPVGVPLAQMPGLPPLPTAPAMPPAGVPLTQMAPQFAQPAPQFAQGGPALPPMPGFNPAVNPYGHR